MDIVMKLLTQWRQRALSTGIALLVMPLIAAELPLVKTKNVQPWHAGIETTLSCQVEAPFDYVIVSESQAKLVLALANGTRVKKGEVLARQDDEYLQLALTEKKELLRQQQLQLDYNKKEYKRISQLETVHVTDSELNQIDLIVQQSSSQLIAIQAQIDTLKKQIGSLTHKAPVDGQVAELTAAIGSFLPTGSSIMKFTAANEKEFKCEMPLSIFRQSSWLELARFYLLGSNKEELELKRVGQNVLSKQQTIPIWLGAERTSLVIGELSQVTMQQAEERLTKIDTSAVIFEGDNKYVWRITNDNAVEKLPVDIVKNLNRSFVIKGELKVGDRVVTIGQTGLKPGAKVKSMSSDELAIAGASK